ncbi:hypothetical protein Taro_017732 [Colocasia esculenta]|uniref:AAA+ ATPase domain-containing protein n=1 Tax=Colocasia esculenta TaxID=4460 RepID=A0A843V085_COLES|nr:hypothetical protein [Colocasia esculenta]
MEALQSFSCFGNVDSTLRRRVGDLVSLLWDLSLGALTNLVLLPRNAERLAEEMGRLRNRKEDLSRKVSREAAQPDMEATNQVKGWMQRVQQVDSEVADFQASLERQSICITGLYLGYVASEKLKKVEALMSEGGSFSSVVVDAAPDADTLAREMEELRNLAGEIKGRIASEEAANSRMRPADHVKSWLERVGACLQPSEGDLEVVNRLIRQVRRLKEDGDRLLRGRDLVSLAPPDTVEELLTVPSSSIVGGEETLAEIRRHLNDDTAGVIGIYGMGGIGKTTLMRKLNNELFESGTVQGLVFDVVIWATVSRDMNILHIQKQIGDRLGLSLSRDPPAQVNKQASSLLKALRGKQFLLFLDDVWIELDWVEIGVPHPGCTTGRNSKIVFTTRSLQVCTDMVADRKVGVSLLNEAQSWQLFRRNLQGDAVLRSPLIRPLAKEVVARCGGLPLSIITVARSMAHKRTPNEWKNAINSLKFRGMDVVLSVLKFSYDGLQDDSMRSCLLYCALFPEDHEIGRDELVEYWVGEGLLDEENSWDDHIDIARGRGHDIVSCLQAACLLESGFSHVTNPYKAQNLQETVRMHDTVRDMALHLSKDRFLAMAGKRLRKLPPAERWGFAQRISFMYNEDVSEFPSGLPPNCPNLSTLLLNSTGIGPSAPNGFFEFMPALRVLDLSRTGIEEVPMEICSLLQLQYLNLSWTSIRSLPRELGSLAMLRQLDLESTSKLESIPREALQKLSNLKVLKMRNSGYFTYREVVDVGSLESLDQLGDLQIDLGTCRSLRRLVKSDLLSRCTTSLTVRRKKGYHRTDGDDGEQGCHTAAGDDDDDPLYGAGGSLLQGIIEELGHQLRQLVLYDDHEHRNRFVGELCFQPDQLPCLEYLGIHSFTEKAKIVVPGGGMVLSILQSLRTLEIYGCHAEFRDLTWAGGLVSLQHLTLYDCRGVNQVLILGQSCKPSHAGSRRPPFPVLREMRLYHLPALSSISERPLLFPCLEALLVFECPRLNRLPLGPRSAPKLRMIRGTQEWWDGLEWDAHGAGDCSGAKPVFLPRFRRMDLGKMFVRRASRIRRR